MDFGRTTGQYLVINPSDYVFSLVQAVEYERYWWYLFWGLSEVPQECILPLNGKTTAYFIYFFFQSAWILSSESLLSKVESGRPKDFLRSQRPRWLEGKKTKVGEKFPNRFWKEKVRGLKGMNWSQLRRRERNLWWKFGSSRTRCDR